MDSSVTHVPAPVQSNKRPELRLIKPSLMRNTLPNQPVAPYPSRLLGASLEISCCQNVSQKVCAPHGSSDSVITDLLRQNYLHTCSKSLLFGVFVAVNMCPRLRISVSWKWKSAFIPGAPRPPSVLLHPPDSSLSSCLTDKPQSHISPSLAFNLRVCSPMTYLFYRVCPRPTSQI